MSDRNNSRVPSEIGRRGLLTGAAATLGTLALGSNTVHAQYDEVSHSAESIHQEHEFKAQPKRVYEALTNADHFDKVIRMGVAMQSGMALGSAKTEISSQVGGAFSIFGGHIVGRQIEIVPVERIVQAWRVVTWAPGIFSIARFVLFEQGSGTKMIFDHTGFPKGEAEHLAAGWKGNYWKPLEKFLG